MQIGKLNKRISIQVATETRNDAGEVAKTWNTVLNGQRWASIEPMSGSESKVAGRVMASVSHVVTLWYMAGVTPANRVVYGARLFDINAVINTDEAGEELKLFCREVV